MKRTYSQQEREQALAMCCESGSYRASKQLGIPQSTLASWMKSAGLRTNTPEKTQAATEARETRIAARRSGVREKLITLTDETLDRMGAPMTIYVGGGKGAPPVPVVLDKPPAGVCKDLATTIGILIDKFRLESGEVTSRDEHRNVEQSDLDKSIDGLLAEMAHREKVGSTEPAAGEEARLVVECAGQTADAAGRLDHVADTGG